MHLGASPQDLEQTSLVPAWVKVLCPNVTKLELSEESTLAPHPLHQSLQHPHLQHLAWPVSWDVEHDPPLAEHVRQQLAALPSLSFLALAGLRWADDGGGEGEPHAAAPASTTVTRLELSREEVEQETLTAVPTLFPGVRDLTAPFHVADDGDLEALLRLPHLQHFCVHGFALERSHAGSAWPWREVSVIELGVESFARLPLDRIPHVSWSLLRPSTDAAAVARVTQAIRRWGGAQDARWYIRGPDTPALLTTLGPLVAALPPAQQQQVGIIDGLHDATPQQVQQLGQVLLASVKKLRLANCRPPTAAWAALLPGLPATVEELDLACGTAGIAEHDAFALCQAAVRPVRVVLPMRTFWMPASWSDEQRERLRNALGGGSLVTLASDRLLP